MSRSTDGSPDAQLGGAERVAREVLVALDREDWPAVTAHVDPVVAERLYRETRDRIESWEGPSSPAADHYLDEDPGMPREVAEYLAEKGRQYMSEAGSFANTFPGLESPEQFRDCSPQEYLALYLGACDPRRGGTLGHPRREVLGIVEEGEETAHVLYRIRWTEESPSPFDHVDMLELRRTGDGWKVLSLDLNGLPRNMWFWTHLDR